MTITIYCCATGEPLPDEAKQFGQRPVYVMPEIQLSDHTEGMIHVDQDLREISDDSENRKQVGQRARKVTDSLVEKGENCVLVVPPLFLKRLMKHLQRKGFIVRRSYIGRIRIGEKMFLTERIAHCGGCGHNCFLSNPGCDVGREKIRRGI